MTDTRELLEKAARACGLRHHVFDGIGMRELAVYDVPHCGHKGPHWNPRTNGGDCAEMNAKLQIDTHWFSERVRCFNDQACGSAQIYFKDHNNDPLAAWMYASTVVAGMMEEMG